MAEYSAQRRQWGTTELRLHGVGGTTPQSLLGDPNPAQVAGDRLAGFYRAAARRSAGAAGRRDEWHVEAYSWGGLTSRSSWRALWLLLLPFMLANLAGWMVPQGLPKRRGWFWGFGWAVRVAALGVTLNLVVLAAIAPVDYLGYQCGGTPGCPERLWSWLSWLGTLADYPARRMALCALVPVALVLALWWLSRTTQSRYEAVQATPSSKGADGAGLQAPDFWNGWRYTALLTHVHVASSLALISALVAYTATESLTPGLWRPSAIVAIALAGAVLVGSVIVLAFGKAGPWATTYGRALLLAAFGSLAATAWYAFDEPPGNPRALAADELPGLQHFLNWGYGLVLAAIAVVAAILTLSALLSAAWKRALLVAGAVVAVVVPVEFLLDRYDQPLGWIVIGCGVGVLIVFTGWAARPVDRPGRGYQRFRWAAPVVALVLAMAAVNTFLIGVLLLIADSIGAIRACDAGRACPTGLYADGEPVIRIFPLIRQATPYLLVVPFALALLFGLWQLVQWWWAGRTGRQKVVDEYQKAESDGSFPPLTAPHSWRASTVEPGLNLGWQAQEAAAWPGQVARARRAAKAAREADLLLTAIAAVGFVLLMWILRRIWVTGDPVSLPQWLVTVCAYVAALQPAALVLVLRFGWRDERNRKLIGALWDVGTFWPRRIHPLAPPSYAERAVPEVQARLRWLADNNDRVLVAAHSQGSIVAAAALVQDGRHLPPPDDIALVTFGSPLRTLYNWGFPAYFDDALFETLKARVFRWRNVSCRTDYIGGTVVTGEAEVELFDPPTSRFILGQTLPAIGSHTGYWEHPGLAHEVGDLVAAFPRDHQLTQTSP